MSSVTLRPVSDGATTDSNFVNASGGTTNLYASVIDFSDATYITTTQVTGPTLWLVLGTLPGDFGTATAVTITLRLLSGTAKGGGTPDWTSVQIFHSDQSTALTASSTISDTSTIANYIYTPALSGSQNAAAWTGAQIAMTIAGVVGNAYPNVYEIAVAVTYTSTGGSAGKKTRGFFKALQMAG